MMPRNYSRKTSKASSYTKEDLQSALEAIQNGTISIKRASLLYKIPRSTLCDHNQGRRGVKSTSLGRMTDIPLAQEQIIADAIRAMEKWGFGLSRREILEKVGEFVRANGLKTRFKNGTPGEDWSLNFKRRQRLSIKKPQNVEIARRKCQDPFIIHEYFDLLKTTLLQLDILEKPEHIWNLDETSFCADPSKTKVVGGIGIPSTRTTSGPGRDNTTVLCACSAAGDKAIPLIIFKGKDVYDEWTTEEQDPTHPTLSYAATKRGWMETPVFYNYFKKNLIKQFGNRRPILLIYDGHSTHVGIDLIKEAMAEKIVILKLPPHSSHILQPLDIAVFKSLKATWDVKLVKWQRCNPGKKIIKKTFSRLIKEVWEEASPTLIQNGFKKAGIYPYDNTVVPKEKFDPIAFRRWEHRNNMHVTADSPNENGGGNIELSSSHVSVETNPENNMNASLSTGNISVEPGSSSGNILPSTSKTDTLLIPFEEILLSTLKQNKNNQDQVKPKKRIASGAEVITRSEVIERLKDIEDRKLKKNKTEKKNTKRTEDEDQVVEPKSKIRKKKSHPKYFEESETEDEEIDICEEESDVSLAGIIDQMEEEDEEIHEIDRQLTDIKEGDWVLVKFPGKKSLRYYVGQVLPKEPGTEADEARIKFTRKSISTQNSVFKFPLVDDIGHILLNDIIKLLPKPKICRRGEIKFSVSFASYSIQ